MWRGSGAALAMGRCAVAVAEMNAVLALPGLLELEMARQLCGGQ